MNIDFVSDVACPWCAVGLNALERALEKLGPEVSVSLRFQPFELNPSMPKEGADTIAYLTKKYGMAAADVARVQQTLQERGRDVGFAFGARQRVWNTFNAHRLMYWAGTQGAVAGATTDVQKARMTKQRALKHALLSAYHTEGSNVSAPEVLLAAAHAAELDEAGARHVIETEEHAVDVRSRVEEWREKGITAVPSVIINEKHLIQGGQPVEVFERALRELAKAQ
jgi:predicted DsbA family dithiol-disulfide isomerase